MKNANVYIQLSFVNLAVVILVPKWYWKLRADHALEIVAKLGLATLEQDFKYVKEVQL